MRGSAVRAPIVSDGWRESRKPAADPPSFVSLVIFSYDHHRDLPAIVLAGYGLRRVWQRQHGAIYLRQWVLPTRRLMGALTVWNSEDALRNFVEGAAHIRIVERFNDRVRGDHIHWRIASFSRRRTWATACSHIANSSPKR
jgi:hypothetical protein